MSSGSELELLDPLELLTFEDLARLWKTGEDWLRKGVSARKYPHHRVAGQIRFTRADAAAILASLAVGVAHIPTADEVAARRAEVGQPIGGRA
ncbi:hypothetical protein [Micromonospora craniellae]|uniref:DNA-binding protein n=1 Tax=Micromonospora craniellae TaxID=2294034 RepID=A0A372G1R3_9ACTN|nr:hypothetical protein [Micromonospora craniellae]QOC89848.1 hypothetical protein ID554_16555 [Micromonospora craniellae]RFS46997.1 hypothetical protein D0Q02_07490 [Micromonospora craniellae]